PIRRSTDGARTTGTRLPVPAGRSTATGKTCGTATQARSAPTSSISSQRTAEGRMCDVEDLRQIEREYRLRFPAAFWKRRKELASLTQTEWFRATYPGARLVGAPEEIRAAQEADPDLPDDLIPFLIVRGQPFPDYYGFQVPRRAAAEAELPVVVWAV